MNFNRKEQYQMCTRAQVIYTMLNCKQALNEQQKANNTDRNEHI